MAYYYLLVVFIVSCICWSSNSASLGHPTNDNNIYINQTCPQIMTYTEIISLLIRTPCSLNISRTKREITTGNVDIYALQATVNNHHTMINYLMNNSVNFTVLSDSVNSRPSRTESPFTTWQDISLLYFHIVILLIVMYLFCCSSQCGLMNRILRCISKSITNHLPNEEPKEIKHVNKKKRKPKEPISTNLQDITSDYHGYMSD